MKTLQSLEQLDAIVYTLVNHTSFDVSEDKEFEYKTYKKDNMYFTHDTNHVTIGLIDRS